MSTVTSDKRLLVGVWIFVIVAFVALLLVLSVVESRLREEAAIEEARQATIAIIYLTNTYVSISGPAIETARAWTLTPSPPPKTAQPTTSGK